MNRPRVCILQERMPQYRVPVYEKLKRALDERGIDLILAHSLPSEESRSRGDEGHLDWATLVPMKTWKIGRTLVYWQSALDVIKGCDLVIVMHHSSSLLNHYLFLRHPFSSQKLALWDHGMNFQRQDSNRFKDALKAASLRIPDWWFGYTRLTGDILRRAGYPAERVTILNNAIDVKEITDEIQRLDEGDMAELRTGLGIRGGNVGVFCGSLYAGRKISMVIDAARIIRERVPDFELVVIGKGSDEPLVRKAAEESRWIHYVGTKFGRERVPFLKLAKIQMIPCAVGLAISDSFAAGLPLATAEGDMHGPEIAYMRSGENGLMTKLDTKIYANAIADLLLDPDKLSAMSRQCREDAVRYSLDNMVANFAEGVQRALATRKK